MTAFRRIAAALLLGLSSQAAAQAPTPDSAKKKDLPLIPARAVDIDTDEGSWISADVSPDGKMVVFDLLGDIYTVPLAGGAAIQITSGMAFDGQPRFSPDGKWIAYTSDRDGGESVWIQNLETKETRQITKMKDKALQSPEWTPDGKYIVVTVGDIVLKPGKLWMFNIDGGTGIQLIKAPETGADHRRRLRAERSIHLVRAAERHMAVRRDLSAIPDRRLRPGDRPKRSAHVALRLRNPPHALARRKVDGVRHALRHRDGTGAAQHADRRREVARVSRDSATTRSRASHARLSSRAAPSRPIPRTLVTSYGGKIWRIDSHRGTATAIPFTAHVKQRAWPAGSHFKSIRCAIPAPFSVRQIRDIAAVAGRASASCSARSTGCT